MRDKYYAQWITESIPTGENNYTLRIVGWSVRELHGCGCIAKVDTEEEARALAKLLNSQADIDQRA